VRSLRATGVTIILTTTILVVYHMGNDASIPPSNVLEFIRSTCDAICIL
jgi:hypothetical protein